MFTGTWVFNGMECIVYSTFIAYENDIKNYETKIWMDICCPDH